MRLLPSVVIFALFVALQALATCGQAVGRGEDQPDEGLHALHAVVRDAGDAGRHELGLSLADVNNRNPNIVDATGKRQIASHYYPKIGPYASSDPDVIEYHLLLMKYAGVDGVLDRLVRRARHEWRHRQPADQFQRAGEPHRRFRDEVRRDVGRPLRG